MKRRFSTREAAKKLGIALVTLQGHVSRETVPTPPVVTIGGGKIRLWSERDIERARKALVVASKPGRKKKL